MDITVAQSAQPDEWFLTDLFGRSLGAIRQTSPGRFIVQPEGGAVETMSGISHAEFASLDAALADIEKRTRGICRKSG
jgi:hypothetical protein